MLIMRATDETYAAFQDVDFTEVIESMGRFNDEMIRAGVLVAAEGLDDPAKGVAVDSSGQPPRVTDAPHGEPRGLFGGSGILDGPPLRGAVACARRAPVAGRAGRPGIRRC